MIISTSKADMMVKRCIGKGQSAINSIDKMLDQFALDPRVSVPPCDVYIVTNEDISANRLREKFEQALAMKHPATRVILINKAAKPIYPNGLPGLDILLQRPDPDSITRAISKVMEDKQVNEIVESTETNVDIPAYEPEPVYEPEPEPEQEVELEQEEPELPEIEEPEYEEPEKEVQPRESDIISRIKMAGTVSDVSVVTREITAANLIKDLYNTNSTYAGIEDKLRVTNEAIYNIMSDPNIKTLKEKLDKIHGFLHDKMFFRAQGDTIIEQRLEEVIDTICDKTSSLLDEKLGQIDQAIRKSYTDKDMENMSPRLAGLNEARANLIIELTTLQQEVLDIYKRCDMITSSTVTEIAAQANDPTSNEIINTQLKAHGQNIVSDETLDAIRAAIDMTSTKVPDEFKQMRLKISIVLGTLRKLFDYDQEIITAQQAVINWLKTNNIENSVVAETLLKKSLRVYVGAEKSGKTIIPYLISKYKARQNSNVLLIDVSGSAKYDQYGIKYTDLQTYITEPTQTEFNLVVGKIDDTIEEAQRLVTTLIKAADYYRIINVVLNVKQEALFKTIAQDVLSVNYIVDTNNLTIDDVKQFMDKNKDIQNVAKRILINRCDVSIRPIISKLGLDDEMDYQVCVINDNHSITDAALNCYDPYSISSVDLLMEEVIKHV